MSICNPIGKALLLEKLRNPFGFVQILEHGVGVICHPDEPRRDSFPDQLSVGSPAKLVCVGDVSLDEEPLSRPQVFDDGAVGSIDVLTGVLGNLTGETALVVNGTGRQAFRTKENQPRWRRRSLLGQRPGLGELGLFPLRLRRTRPR